MARVVLTARPARVAVLASSAWMRAWALPAVAGAAGCSGWPQARYAARLIVDSCLFRSRWGVNLPRHSGRRDSGTRRPWLAVTRHMAARPRRLRRADGRTDVRELDHGVRRAHINTGGELPRPSGPDRNFPVPSGNRATTRAIAQCRLRLDCHARRIAFSH